MVGLRALLICFAVLAMSPQPLVAGPLSWLKEIVMAEPTPRSDRLFKGHDEAAYELARRIEQGEDMSPEDFAPVSGYINRRYGDDITLLFHAIASANLDAVDALLAAGADTRQPDKPEGSTRDFVSYLGSPGGPLIDQDGITEMIRSYLRHGGDPNVRMQGKSKNTLISEVALIGNESGFQALLKAGADPWAWDMYMGETQDSNAMTKLASEANHFALLNDLVDQGYFDSIGQKELSMFLSWLSNFAQRGDERSKNIQALAKRVLKRNQEYKETDNRFGTVRIFKDHWKDSGPGEIPWDEIRSDAVK